MKLDEFMEKVEILGKEFSIYTDEEKGVSFPLNTVHLLTRDDMLELSKEIKNHHHDLLFLRERLVKYKNHGMDKERMLKNLEKMRSNSDLETEDILLELMDFINLIHIIFLMVLLMY